MPARKMRVELFDEEGNRYTISFEGQITREKALRLIDLVELLGGVPAGRSTEKGMLENEFSKYDKMRLIIQKHFPLVWFTSHDVQMAYEQEFKEPIGLSTVATYLSRMSSKGLLLRAGTSKTLKYKLATSPAKAIIERQAP